MSLSCSRILSLFSYCSIYLQAIHILLLVLCILLVKPHQLSNNLIVYCIWDQPGLCDSFVFQIPIEDLTLLIFRGAPGLYINHSFLYNYQLLSFPTQLYLFFYFWGGSLHSPNDSVIHLTRRNVNILL